MDQDNLLDVNLYKTITSCYINKKHPNVWEVFVIYSDGMRESIWTFNPTRYDFTRNEFIGLTKIAAVFHCDRKEPKNRQLM